MNDYISEYYRAQHNQYETRRAGESVDKDGNPIPWITYPALFQLEQFDFSASELFEWGSGYSTLYWSSRCASVVSIEHDRSWFDFVAERKPDNVSQFHRPLSDYAGAIEEKSKSYDIIVIDGYIHEGMRRDCARRAISHLREGGLLLLDNSDWLPNTCQDLRDEGFQQFDYCGFSPINNYPLVTSIFFRDALRFPRVKPSPGHLPGGLDNLRD